MEQGCQVLALYDFLFSKQPEQSSIWQRQLLTQQLACCQLLSANNPARQKCSSPTFALQLPLKKIPEKKKSLKFFQGVSLWYGSMHDHGQWCSPGQLWDLPGKGYFPGMSRGIWCIPGPPQTYQAGGTSLLHSSSIWPSCGAQAAGAWTALFDSPFQLLHAKERFRRDVRVTEIMT